MTVTHWRRRETPLAEFPGWAVEIMIGLYGEEQVREVIEAQSARRRSRRHLLKASGTQTAEPTPAGPAGDIAAVTGAFDAIGRFLRGRRG